MPDTANSLPFEVELALPFEEAATRTREALKTEGFGILTEIDLQAAFREKLGKPFRPYVILGACSPPLAYAAVTSDPRVGLLLPCNVTVEAVDDSRSLVRLTDPEQMLQGQGGFGGDELSRVAVDARARMERVAGSLRRG